MRPFFPSYFLYSLHLVHTTAFKKYFPAWAETFCCSCTPYELWSPCPLHLSYSISYLSFYKVIVRALPLPITSSNL